MSEPLAPTRIRHHWRAIAGSELLHAWKSRRSRSVTYCGITQFRSKANPAPENKRCATCVKIVARMESERRRVAMALEAIRPKTVDPVEWRKQAERLIELV